MPIEPVEAATVEVEVEEDRPFTVEVAALLLVVHDDEIVGEAAEVVVVKLRSVVMLQSCHFVRSLRLIARSSQPA